MSARPNNSATRCPSMRPTCTCWRWRPPSPTSGRRTLRPRRSKRRRGAAVHRPHPQRRRAGGCRAGPRCRAAAQHAGIVGFAAETGDANGDVLFHARAKLQRKGCEPASGQCGLVTVKPSRSTTTTVGLLAADGNRVGVAARLEDSDGQPYRGRDRHVLAEGALGTPPRLPAP